jgi:hypothetical protein
MQIRYGTMSGLCALLLAVQVGPAGAQDAAPQTLFTNVHVFDGVNEARIENANILIEGNLTRAAWQRSRLVNEPRTRPGSVRFRAASALSWRKGETT